jgi:hypothetical protein
MFLLRQTDSSPKFHVIRVVTFLFIGRVSVADSSTASVKSWNFVGEEFGRISLSCLIGDSSMGWAG